ncbi:MAG TPA: apolipoprotein N-acyltransferase [Thermodesulfobacteriota bacterium]
MIASQVKRLDYFWAAVSGGLLVLSFPIVDLWPLAWFFLVPLLLCTRGKHGKDAFLLGAFAGVIAYLGLIYWVVVAVHRYGNIPLPLAIPVLLFLVIYLSLYWGVFAFFASFAKEKGQWVILLALPALWVGLEYLRSFLLSGFPWALVGYSQHLNTAFVQIADITGVYGVSFLLILINTLLFLWLVRWKEKKKVPIQGTIFTVILIALTFAYGYWRINRPAKAETGFMVAVAQGNIPQDVKWDDAFQKKTLAIYRDLSLQLKERSPALIVWPETAVPSYFPSGTELDDKVMGISQETGAYLLVGSLSEKAKKKGKKEVRGVKDVYNSAYLLSPQRRIIGRYDKLHLVPFGEYIPLSSRFPILNTLAGIWNIEPGEEAELFRLPRGTFGVLICFEVIFPELCRESARKGADFMVTITNDAWFGKTSAPYQHLSQATFRAIENRMWLVRAANTGISAFVDPLGRIHKASNLFTPATLTEEITFKANTMTFYTRYGDLFAIACSLLGLVLIGYIVLKRQVIWL